MSVFFETNNVLDRFCEIRYIRLLKSSIGVMESFMQYAVEAGLEPLTLELHVWTLNCTVNETFCHD